MSPVQIVCIVLLSCAPLVIIGLDLAVLRVRILSDVSHDMLAWGYFLPVWDFPRRMIAAFQAAAAAAGNNSHVR